MPAWPMAMPSVTVMVQNSRGVAPTGGDPKLDRLGLAHQRDIAGRGLVPAGGDADERLMNLLPRQPHRVIERAVRRAVGAFGGVPAWQPQFQIGFGVHQTLAGQTGPRPSQSGPKEPNASVEPEVRSGDEPLSPRRANRFEKSYG